MGTHSLDGYDAQVGDKVYDVAFGSGKVDHLGDNGSISVRFGDGRTAGYNGGRTRRFTVRTLYWHNPVVAAPPKDTVLWEIVRAAAAAISATLKRPAVRTAALDEAAASADEEQPYGHL